MSLADNLKKVQSGKPIKKAPKKNAQAKRGGTAGNQTRPTAKTKKKAPVQKEVKKAPAKPETALTKPPENKTDFTDKQFCHALIQNSMNAKAAYHQLKPEVAISTATTEASKRLRKPNVIATLTPMLEELFANAGIETEYVFRRWLEMAQASPLDYFNITADGNLGDLDLSAITPAQRMNLRSIRRTKSTTISEKGSETTTETIHVQVVDQQKAVDTIGKHLGLLVEKLADEDVERIGDMLEKGVSRIKKTRDLEGWRDVILDAEFTKVS